MGGGAFGRLNASAFLRSLDRGSVAQGRITGRRRFVWLSLLEAGGESCRVGRFGRFRVEQMEVLDERKASLTDLACGGQVLVSAPRCLNREKRPSNPR